jgi:hypothetical protein
LRQHLPPAWLSSREIGGALGLLLDEAFLRFAVRNDVLIAMSFDGIREAHDLHRRLPNGGPTFDVLLERLRMLLAVRPYASVLMVVNPQTAAFLVDSVSFLLDVGCRYLIVSLNYAADWNEANFRTLTRQYRKLGSLYVKWTRRTEVLPEPVRGQALVAHQSPLLPQGALRAGRAADLGGPAGLSVPVRAVSPGRVAEPLVHRARFDGHRRGGTAKAV